MQSPTSADTAGGTQSVQGTACAPFAPLAHLFQQQIENGAQLGAGLCVYLEGRKVVDLWGGYQNKDKTTAWQADTLTCLMSATKGVAALAVFMLAHRGALSLTAPVSRYWPEFARGGKATTTVEQVLAGKAGLPYADAAPEGSIYNWGTMTAALERQLPEWPPGSRGAYHSTTIGFLLGELVQRVDGRDIGRFIKEEIADPLAIDFSIGLSETDHARTADSIPNAASNTIKAATAPDSSLARAWRVMPADRTDMFNSPAWRHALFPSGNGYGTARGLAKIYAVLANGGTLDGVTLVGADLVNRMRTVEWDAPCGLTGRSYRYGLGFFLNREHFSPMGPNDRAFGHPGLGGVLGFADPEAGLAFGYAPNLLSASDGVGSRCEALVATVYECMRGTGL